MNNNIQIYKLSKSNNNLDKIKDHKNTELLLTSDFPNYSLFSLGYHHYIDRTRETMFTTQKKPEFKNEFYYVVNPYEQDIKNYNESLKIITLKYLGDNKELNTNSFYKLWEILMSFDLEETGTYNIIDNEDFKYCIEQYRKKFYPKIKKMPKKVNKYDLIIINHSNVEEIDYYIELLKYVKNILETQNKNGSLILKLEYTFTMPTLKIINILCNLYNEVYIYKPLFSRLTESEKFLVCTNYKESSYVNKIIEDIDYIVNNIENKYLNDIFINMELSEDFINQFKYINTKLVNLQQILINDIIVYINENNYYGDKFHEYKQNQINSTKEWISIYYPNSTTEHKTFKSNIKQNNDSIIEKNNLKKDKFITIN